jgi:hypothetical protein
MRAWETVEISINKIDVADIITTSFNTTDTPLTPGGGIMDPSGSGSKDVAGNYRD